MTMESCVMAAVFLNYDSIIKDTTKMLSSLTLLREIQILLLSPNIIIPSFQLPMIRMLVKQNRTETIKEGIRKTLGVKSKSLKMTEVSISADRSRFRSAAPLVLVFLNTMDCEKHVLANNFKSQFVFISDLCNVTVGEQSMDYISAIKRWIQVESIDPASLLEWFRPQKRGEVNVFKLKSTSTPRCGLDRLTKSTSLDTIARPDLTNSENPSRKQADSLDRISRKEKVSTSSDLRNAIRRKIAQSKAISNSGPINPGPMLEVGVSDRVVHNPLLRGQPSDFSWNTEIVIKNPFWGHQMPDRSQITTNGKTLFCKEKHVSRCRPWSLDFPLHFAAHKGDILLVSPLVDRGYSCLQRDQHGWTPFHYAVWNGHLDIVTLFLQSQLVSVNRCTEDHLSPLHLAIVNGQTSVASLLLKQPDIDITLQSSHGDDARTLSERYDRKIFAVLIKTVPLKLSRVTVTLTDDSVRSLLLTNGPDTTIQQLRMQMIDILDLPSGFFDVFSFWVSFKTPKFTGKSAVIPCECFGPPSTPIRDLTPADWRLLWKRNVFLGLEAERRVKRPLVVRLLFEEARRNFTRKSRYSCDGRDLVLLASVLLQLQLPPADSAPAPGRRTLSLNRVSRPLSSLVLGSRLGARTREMSASVQTLDRRSTPAIGLPAASPGAPSDRSTLIDQRSRQAKSFLSSVKNLALVMPKKKLKDSKVNWSEEITKKFLQSSYSYKQYSQQETEYRFLTLCWNLTLYGCAYFHIEVKLNASLPFNPCVLAVNDMGVYFLHARTKGLLQNFRYSSMTWHASPPDKCLLIFTRTSTVHVRTRQASMVSQLMLRLHSVNP